MLIWSLFATFMALPLARGADDMIELDLSMQKKDEEFTSGLQSLFNKGKVKGVNSCRVCKPRILREGPE